MSEARHYARHIMLKRSVWHFRMVVPLDLRSTVGLSEVRISLRTGYARQAAVKARRLAAAGEAMFNRIRKKELPDMDRRELARMIKRYFQQHLDEYEDHMVMNGPDTEERHKESLAELGVVRERVQKSISLRRYDTVSEDVARFARDNELVAPPDSPEYRTIAHEILKANLDMLTVLFHRQQGDYNSEDALLAKYAEDAPPQPAPTVQTASEPQATPSIGLFELIDKFCADKIKRGYWSGRGITEGPRKFEALKFILGDVPVSTINAETALHVLDGLQRLPMRLDAARFKGKSLNDLLDLEGEKRLSVKSINMRMDDATGLFNFAVENDFAAKNYFQNRRIRDEESDEEKRHPFTEIDLALIFEPRTFMSHCGSDVSRYWIPILGLYTGARLEELAQLRLEDVYEIDDILVFNVNDKDSKRLKNKSSRRLIPVHDVVRRKLGFEQFVADQRRAGCERLFHKLPYNSQRYGHKPSRDFNRYLRKIGIEKKKTFHSFRHSFIDFLRNKGVSDDLIASMTGHKPVDKSPIPKNYKEKHWIHFVVEKVLDNVDYGVDLSHLLEWRKHVTM